MFTKQTMLRASVLVAIAASTSLVAKADALDYTLTGPGTDITFSLPSNPAPTEAETGVAFQLDNVTLDVNGTNVAGDNLYFIRGADGGGLTDLDGLLGADGTDVLNHLGLYGAQLYSGSESDPTLLTGDFKLKNYNNGADYSLDVTDVSAAVAPEPASLLLLGTGLLALIGMGSVRRFAGGSCLG